MLTFGDNSLGQLGRREQQHGACSAEDWVVRKATGKPLSACSIAAGLSHKMAVLKSGQVIFCHLPPLSASMQAPLSISIDGDPPQM